MKLIDLNIDCLQSILDYLPYADLLNAADSSKRLLHAARFVIAEWFGDRIRITTDEYVQRDTASRFSFMIKVGPYDHGSKKTHRIYEEDMKCGLQTVRCLAPLIHGIKTIFIFNDIFGLHTDHIVDYLSDILKEFECRVDGRLLIDFERVRKPFTSVEYVHIYDIYNLVPNSNTSDTIVKLFPKIRKLDVSGQRGCEIFHKLRYLISGHIPQLESFKSNIYKRIRKPKGYHNHKVPVSCGLCSEIYANIFRLNPQLKSVDLSKYRMDIDLFKVLTNLQNLEFLKIRFQYLQFADFDGLTIYLKNLKHLDILHDNYPYNKRSIEFICVNEFNIPYDNLNPMQIFPFSCDQLQKLTVQLTDHTQFKDNLYDFCMKNASIKELHLFNSTYLDTWPELIMTEVPRLVQILPELEKIQFKCYDNVTVTDSQLDWLKLVDTTDPQSEIYQQLLDSFKDHSTAGKYFRRISGNAFYDCF